MDENARAPVDREPAHGAPREDELAVGMPRPGASSAAPRARQSGQAHVEKPFGRLMWHGVLEVARSKVFPGALERARDRRRRGLEDTRECGSGALEMTVRL